MASFKYLGRNEQFRNYNFGSDLQQVTEAGLVEQLAENCDPNSSKLPPLFADIFPFTLSSACCQGFLSQPGLPHAPHPRDYYLSKLNQFLLMLFHRLFVVYDESVVEDSLRDFLKSIPDEMLPHLHECKWQEIFDDIKHKPRRWRRFLERLPAYLPSVRGLPENSVPPPPSPLEEAPILKLFGAQPVRWTDVRITARGDREIEISIAIAPRPTRRFAYSELGFESEKNGKPILAWTLLIQCLKHQGELPQAVPSRRSVVKQQWTRLRKQLKLLFGLKEDPLVWSQKGKCYRAQFNVSQSRIG